MTGNGNRTTVVKFVQNKFTKLLTLPTNFRIFALHTEQHKQKMRTKTLLLTAALVVAGAATSMAQSNVYSLNVVGYINIPLASGYNLIANQLDGSNNVVSTVFPTAPDGAIVSKWNPATQSFKPGDTYYAGSGWFDDSFTPSVTTLNPGEGFFLNNPGSATTVTITGQVRQGTNSTTLNSNYGFFSSVPPVVSGFSTNGFPAQDGMIVSTFSGGSYHSVGTYYAGSGWFDDSFVAVDPAPAVGTGFLLLNPATAQTWTRAFVVQ